MKRATRREMLENFIVPGGLVAAVPTSASRLHNALKLAPDDARFDHRPRRQDRTERSLVG
jgi:hypothetical protein